MSGSWWAVGRIALFALGFLAVVLWLHESRKRMRRRERKGK